MTEITSQGGLVNIDFADMRSIMDGGGVAMIGMGEGQGTNRASIIHTTIMAFVHGVDKVNAALFTPVLPVSTRRA